MSTLKPAPHEIRHYTLLEVLAVMALVAILLTAALRLYYEGSRLVRKSADRAQGIMDVNILKTWWRSCVRPSNQVFIVQPDKVVFTNRQSVSIKKSTLIFNGQQGVRTLMLPSGMTAEFSMEKNVGEPSCLVLWVKPSSYRERNRETANGPRFRLVAALPEESKP